MMWMTKQSIVLMLAFAVSLYFANVKPVRAESGQIGSLAPQSRLAVIESVSVSGEGHTSELVIKLSAPATYTSYKTTSPLRLVIDLSQTTQGTAVEPLVLNKGNFKVVNASRYDTDAGVLTRVEIELLKDAEPLISASPEQPGELRISFPGLPVPVVAGQISSTDESHAAIALEKPLVQSAQAEEAAANPVAAAVLPKSPPVADVVSPPVATIRTLTSIVVKNDSIILAINGGAGEFKTFRLDKPERFVLDLFGVNSSMANRIIPVNAVGVASARLGMYPDKVRVVFDAINGSFSEVSASKFDGGVAIALSNKPFEATADVAMTAGEKGAAEKAVAEKDVAEFEPAVKTPQQKQSEESTIAKSAVPHAGAPTVEMIDFQLIEGISRVSVKVLGDVKVDAPLSSPGFVTLSIKNAVLPKRLQRSLESQGFISPVLRITPVSVKTRKGTDVKVRIALRKAVPHEFRQEGDMLFVDFKNPEGMTADKVSRDLQESRLPVAHGTKGARKESELGSELAPPVEQTAKSSDSSRIYKGRKVTLEFADAEVRKIFQLLSEVSNKNFVLGDDVTGTISIKLVNVPWDQALDIILDTKGLDKREDGNIIIIKGKGKFRSQADEEMEIKKTLYKSMELKAETFSVNYADISGIVSQFTALKTERGTIAPDTRTNKVIVKDIPQIIEDMRKLLAQLDVPEKQVMIEARIVEATSTFSRSIGVNWGVHYTDATATFLGINKLDTGFGGLTSAPPSSGTGTSDGGNMGISFGTLGSNVKLDLRLSAAASAGLVRIVSTPKVATLNNKTAKISQGQQIPYQNTTATTGAVTAFVAATLSLEVTPHINANGTIGMKIDAKNDAPGDGTPPAINTKSATTELLLRDGETTVIGGIYVDIDNDSDAGVPFLMDIPFLGKLFKANKKSKTKSELLIFITPRILNSI